MSTVTDKAVEQAGHTSGEERLGKAARAALDLNRGNHDRAVEALLSSVRTDVAMQLAMFTPDELAVGARRALAIGRALRRQTARKPTLVSEVRPTAAESRGVNGATDLKVVSEGIKRLFARHRAS